MSISSIFRWKGMLFYLATMSGLLGQVASSSQTTQQASPSSARVQVSQNQATIQAFQTEQMELAHQEIALMKGGATQAQLKAWHQQNAAEFALQQQRAEAMSAASALQPRPTIHQINIPANASPALNQFLTTQATLGNAEARIHNQLLQQATASGQSLTSAQVGQMERQENRLFRQQNASLQTLQAQRVQALANVSAQTIQPVPGPVIIPTNATPQMAAYLTTQNQIRRQLIQLKNQYANASPAVREAALQAWSEQNASQLTQMRQQAQSLSQASSPTQN